jgi:tetratricopeptide (TPR) repeat protein
MRGVLAEEKEDLETAERIFGECADAHPTEAVAIERATKFFDAQGKPERTLEILRKALAESPALGGVRRELSTRLRASGQTAEAERLLREGTELENPGAKLEAWVDLANHHHEVGDDAAAASALEHALELPGA